MPSHVSITDPNLHEPKGIASASEGAVYVATGTGSGQWLLWPYGKAFYQHSTTGQIIDTTASKLQINGLGALTRTAQLPREIRGSGNLWDTTNNKITPIRLNDGYTIRVDIPVTAETASPTEFNMELDVGGGAAPSIVATEVFAKTGRAVPYTLSFGFPLDVLTNDTLNNGIQLFCMTDVGSVTVGSPGILIVKIADGLL